MSAVGFISHRVSIRWPPGEASEPTNTIVLMGARRGIFLDTRFIRVTKKLDWAFAGYRSQSTAPSFVKPYISSVDESLPDIEFQDGSVIIKFKHCIDSRNLDEVEDSGTNIALPDGTTLEIGEMLNPETGKIASFEEIWRDEVVVDAEAVLFVKNTAGTKWQARVGRWQHAMGRGEDGVFWAWQGDKEGDDNWSVRYSTDSRVIVKWLPVVADMDDWKEGSVVRWGDDDWEILERGDA